MASRHVDVNERRLRPVYDALDNLNNRKAIQQADKILKKQKDLHCAKVLKSIALLRSGKYEECEKLMKEVKKMEICDDATLQAMTICYREMEKHSEICDIYEIAQKKSPKNEELCTHLFMSYVRTSQFKKQQQVAMNLYKTFKKNPYYFWAVMSYVLQANVCEDERTRNGMLLPLAEKMILKFIKEKKIESEAELYLYLIVLEMQNKHECVLETINGPLGEFLSPHVKAKKTIKYLSKLERWCEVNIFCRNQIQSRLWEWSNYKAYFESLTKLIEANYEPDTCEDGHSCCGPDYTLFMASDFIGKLKCKELESNERKSRVPFLACLHLEKMTLDKRIHASSTECTENVTKLMVEYFQLFGDKSVCFSDLCTYLDLLDSSKKLEFLELCRSLLCKTDEDQTTENIQEMSKTITTEKFSRYLGEHENMSAEEKIARARHLMFLHRDGLKYGQNLLSTDIQPCDDFALLAAHLLLDCCDWSDMKGHSNSWYRVLVALESAMKSSSSNIQFKLLGSRLYCVLESSCLVSTYSGDNGSIPKKIDQLICSSSAVPLINPSRDSSNFEKFVKMLTTSCLLTILTGAFDPCVANMDSMDVKHILYDTLGSNISRYAAPLGHFEYAKDFYSLVLKFYQSNRKDTPEYVISSYKYGSFQKIIEILNFQKKLENSFFYPSILLEQKFLDVVLLANSASSIREIFVDQKLPEDFEKSDSWLDKLQDNRDLEILDTWNEHDRHSSEEARKTSFQHELLWLKLRLITIKAVTQVLTGSAHSDISSSGNSTHQNSNCQQAPKIVNDSPVLYRNFTQELQDLFTEVRNSELICKRFPLYGPLPTRWNGYLDGSYDELLISCLSASQLAPKICRTTNQGDEMQESMATMKNNFTRSLTILKDNATLCSNSLTFEDNGKKFFNGSIVESLVLLLEAISVVLVFLQHIRSILSKATHLTQNKKKRKVLPPAQKEFSEAYQSFADSLYSVMSGIHNNLLDEQLLHLTEDLTTLDMNELYKLTDSGLSTEIWDKMQYSYKTSVKGISDVYKVKLDFLKTLFI